ncbi:sugar phosphate isomerase/epimerase family protein [Halopiger goleimassiliensis]|uniref:sugar phosphate isomerase/epimerase family protein n=1 Tax=Halopiger goleimassiliensis TaxID=1293048 RepID=UPI0006777204|nr:sugar phosphate isomerase/epimerase [Halopiger goleimassiliensis]
MTGRKLPRIGASLDIRYDESVESIVEFLVDRGLNHLELRHGYLDVRGRPSAERLREIATDYDVTYTVHAPHIDATLANVNERLREASVEAVTDALEFAAAIDAGGVVVHGGSTRNRYPDAVDRHQREQAITSIRECVACADRVGVPLCLENQRETASKFRYTATPDRLERFLESVDAGSDRLKLTLDVGHAKATGVDYESFVERFGDRIHVVHLHDNDGTADDHEPLPGYEAVVDRVDAPYNVLEMKSLADVDRCVRGSASDRTVP